MKILKATALSRNIVKVEYKDPYENYQFSVEWTNISPADGSECEFYPDIAESLEVEFGNEKIIRELLLDEESNAFYTCFAETFYSSDAYHLAQDFIESAPTKEAQSNLIYIVTFDYHDVEHIFQAAFKTKEEALKYIKANNAYTNFECEEYDLNSKEK